MESTQDTPLFEWPNLEGRKQQGETYDREKGRMVYPVTKPSTHREEGPRTAQELDAIRKRVQGVLKVMDLHIGNVVPWIVNDLAGLAAEKERDLMPKLDYVNPVFYYDITPDCKAMMAEKIKRAQRHIAHDLAMDNMVDIAVTWYGGPDPEVAARTLMVPPEQQAVMKKAWEMTYGCLDADRMYRKPQPNALSDKDDETEVTENDVRRQKYEESLPPPQNLGGFYAIVKQEQRAALRDLQAGFKINIITCIEPKLMTDKECDEMDEYYASRRAAEKAAVAQKELELEAERKEARKAAEEKHAKRKPATYSATVQEAKDRSLSMDFRSAYQKPF